MRADSEPLAPGPSSRSQNEPQPGPPHNEAGSSAADAPWTSGDAGEEGWLSSARRRLASTYSGVHDVAIDTRHRDDVERLLAICRLALGVTLVAAVGLGHPELHPPIAHVLGAVYAIYAALIAGVAWIGAGLVQGRALHVADLVWATLLTGVSGGVSSSAYPLFLFVIVSGGYRWGLARSLLDGGATVVLACALSVPALAGATPWAFEIDVFLMRVSYTVILAVLFGALAERQLVLNGQATALASLVGKIGLSPSLGSAIRAALDRTLRLLDARQVFLVIEEVDTRRTFLWHTWRKGSSTHASYVELAPEARALWLPPIPTGVWACYARRAPRTTGAVPVSLALDLEGRPLATTLAVAEPLAGAWPWRSLMFVPFGERNEGMGRLYVIDLDRRPFIDSWLRFLLTLARQVSPILMSRYLLRRVRMRIGSRERARLSLELHDSLVQSLVALEMRLDVLGRRTLAGDPEAVAEISAVRTLLHNEILGVRDLMQRLQSVTVDAKRLPFELETIAERFTRSSNITARIDWAVDTLDLAPQACREVVLVVQEALVNVRLHSGATRVMVRVEADAGGWGLIVEDNGHGLGVTGRFPPDHPEARRIGPRVIRERVTGLGGTLAFVSSPNGLRLEMAFPLP